MKELSSYGKHYDSIVADINNQRLYEGRSDLLYYDVGKMYNQNKIEFSALSDKLKDAPTNVVSQDVATGRQLGEQSRAEKKRAAAEKYGLSVKQYDDMKRDIASKGITNVTQEQINQAVAEVKSRGTPVTITGTGEDVKMSKTIQRNFREANPNLNPNTNFTDSQINTLNQGGSVNVNNEVFASA